MSGDLSSEIFEQLGRLSLDERRALVDAAGIADPTLRDTIVAAPPIVSGEPTLEIVPRAIQARLLEELEARREILEAPTLLGSAVGSVRIETLLGRGGIGRVYRGFDERLQRRVAVKILRRRHRRHPLARTRFMREARLLSRLNHPRICQLYGLEETEAGDVLILELVEGETLKEVLARPIPRPARLQFGLQIADALAAAHRRGVIHRDLKPDNVMITAEGQVKVLDFGIGRLAAEEEEETEAAGVAAAVDPSEVETSHGSIVGTLSYMSPEQARGEPVTPASDIYSFGLLLQQLLTGEPPTEKGTPQDELVAAAAAGRSKPPRGLPRDLTLLIRRLKSLEPNERPTAVEVHQALQRILDRPRRRLRQALAVVVVLVTVGGATKHTIDLRRKTEEAETARSQAEELVSFMLDDLLDRLEPFGRLDVLEQVARQALEYFDALPESSVRQAGARPGEALRQVGDVLLARGELDGAQSAFERARDLDEARRREDPDDPERLHAVALDLQAIGRCLEPRGDLDAAAEVDARATELMRRLVAEHPDEPKWRATLAEHLTRDVSSIHRSRDDPESARAALLEGIGLLDEATAETPDDVALLHNLGGAHYAHGLFLLVEEARPEDARRAFRRAIEIYRRLAREEPSNPGWRYRLAILAGQGLCGSLLSQGRAREAAEECATARTLLQELVRLDPGNGRWGHALVWEHIRHASVEEALGNLHQAGADYREAEELQARLLERSPDHEAWQDAYAWSLQGIAEYEEARGRLDEARDAAARSRDVRRRLMADTETVYYTSALADVLAYLAELDRARGDTAAALDSLEEARAVVAPLARQGPESITVRGDLAAVELQRGLLLAELGREEEASDAYDTAVALLAPLTERTDAPVSLLEHQALALLLAGDLEGARVLVRRLVADGWPDDASEPELAARARSAGLI